MMYNFIAHKKYIFGSRSVFLGLRTRTGGQVRRFLAGFHLMFIYAAPVNRTRGSAYKCVGMLTKLWADCVLTPSTVVDIHDPARL
jgi:hypothetical protein